MSVDYAIFSLGNRVSMSLSLLRVVTLALRLDRYRARSGALLRNAHENNNATTMRDTQTRPRSARKGNSTQ